MRSLFTVASLGYAAALSASSLRGAPKNSTLARDDRGERGHFYYAESCEDCVFKGAQCGCEPAMEYLACVTKHCHKASDALFADKCTSLSGKCGKDLDIKCRGEKTSCKAKYMQLPMGGIGLTVTVNSDKAYCGPFGKCLGSVVMNAVVTNRPTSPPPPPVSNTIGFHAVAANSPAPAVASAPSPAGAPAPVVAVQPPPPPPPPVFMVCALPKKRGADIEDKEEWTYCKSEVKNTTASCKMSLFKELKAEKNAKSYCVLVDKDDKTLTQPYWTKIINVHEKVEVNATVAATKVEKKEKTEEKKEKKEEKAEKKEKVEKKEKEDKKEAKEEKKEAKVEKKEVKVEKKEADDSGKLPWMVDKEERADKREAAKAMESKEAKLASKEAKKDAKPKTYGENDSGLPWQEGKDNTKQPVTQAVADATK